MEGCTQFGRYVLITLNTLFVLVSLGIIALGVQLKYFGQTVLEGWLGSLDSLSEETKELFGLPDLENVADLPFVGQLGTALIIFGAIMLILSVLPCCGACCLWRPFLILFVCLMLILIVCQALVGGLYMTKDSVFHETVKEKMGNKVKNEYLPNSNDFFSVSINCFNYMLGCCGIRGWEDFPPDLRPASCCNRTIIEGGQDWMEAAVLCVEFPQYTPDIFYNSQGCYSVVQSVVMSNFNLIAYIFSSILFLQLVEVVFACLIVKEINERNKVFPQ